MMRRATTCALALLVLAISAVPTFAELTVDGAPGVPVSVKCDQPAANGVVEVATDGQAIGQPIPAQCSDGWCQLRCSRRMELGEQAKGTSQPQGNRGGETVVRGHAARG